MSEKFDNQDLTFENLTKVLKRHVKRNGKIYERLHRDHKAHMNEKIEAKQKLVPSYNEVTQEIISEEAQKLSNENERLIKESNQKIFAHKLVK